jgi:hypothetical protein
MAVKVSLPAQVEDAVLMYALALEKRGGTIAPLSRPALKLARRALGLHWQESTQQFVMVEPPEGYLEKAGFDPIVKHIIDYDKFNSWADGEQ